MFLDLKHQLKNHFINNRVYYIFISFIFIAGISCGFNSYKTSAGLYSFFTSKVLVSGVFLRNIGKNLLFSFLYVFSGFTVLCIIIVFTLVFVSGCVLGAEFVNITQIKPMELFPFIFLSFVRFVIEVFFMIFQATPPLRCSQKIISRRIKGIKKPLYYQEKRNYISQNIFILVWIIPLSLSETIIYKILSCFT